MGVYEGCQMAIARWYPRESLRCSFQLLPAVASGEVAFVFQLARQRV